MQIICHVRRYERLTSVTRYVTTEPIRTTQPIGYLMRNEDGLAIKRAPQVQGLSLPRRLHLLRQSKAVGSMNWFPDFTLLCLGMCAAGVVTGFVIGKLAQR